MKETMEKVQETLSERISWDDAEKKDKLNSKFFNVESNMKYKLTFSDEPMEDKDAFDGQCITGRLIKKVVPVWANGMKTDQTEEKVVLQLVIDSLDGSPCMKLWNVKNAKMRNLFRTYAENNLLVKKIFVVEVKGELMKGNYNIVALDKPGAKKCKGDNPADDIPYL